MKNVMMLACLLASGLTLSGQTAASSVAGQVVNSTTGAPVRRTTISLRLSRGLPVAAGQAAPASGVNTMEADDQGRFAFRNVTPGGYVIIAQRQGFLDPGQSQTGRPTAILMVGENQQITGAVVRLTPHSVIAGKVLDAEGEPFAGVQVSALRWAYVNGKRQLSRMGSGSMIATNDLGEYRIAGLAAGEYFVMAGAPRASTAYYSSDQRPQAAPELVYTNSYYPAATGPAAATPVRVPAGGEVRGMDIKLVKVKAVSIRGQVIDPGAMANRPATISVVSRSGAGGSVSNSVGYGVPSAGGAFQVSGVPAGSYYLVTRRSDGQGQTAAGAVVPIEVADKNLDGITIQVSPAVEVQGVVKSGPAGRCAGFYISLSEESGNLNVQGTNIGGDSKFILKSVVPATYTLNVPGASSCYLQSVRFGGRDADGMRVKIDGSGPLEITLVASEATVDGTVTDSSGKPVDGAMVTFLPKDGAPAGIRTASASRNGSFNMVGMQPGEYDAFAWERADYSAAQSPDYVKQFASRAKSITVQAAGRQSVQLRAIPASATGEPVPLPALLTVKGSVEGQVVNAVTGAPLGGANVILGTQRTFRPPVGMAGAVARVGANLGGQTLPPAATVEADAQGRFAIRNVEPDIYFISAGQQGFSGAGPPGSPNMIGDQIVVGNGQRITSYTLKLSPQSVIVGKVTDEFGDAVANAQAVLYSAQYVRGSRRLARQGMVQTDDLGKFRLSGMAPGSYYLAVMKQAQARMAGRGPQAAAVGSEPGMGYGMIWYPNATDAAGASPIVVGGAAEVPIEVVLRRTRVVRIRGSVVDPAGGPVERAMVALAPRGLGTATSIGSLRMTPGGAFEIANVPAGSYTLSARVLNSGTISASGTQFAMAFLPVEVRDANLEDIKLQLTTGKEVRGTVRWEGGGAQSAYLTASAAEGFSASASAMNGVFALRPVWPLTYTLDVGGLCPNCFVKSLRYGGRDVPEAGIEFNGDGELEVVVSASAASLDGVAADRQGRPAGGATVMLEPADGTGRILSGKADALGAFHFGGLRPGAYRVYAWEGAAPEASPAAVAPFQAQASTVRLEERERGKLQIATIKR